MNTDVMFSSKEQTWATPISFFNRLNDEFNFTLDACALPEINMKDITLLKQMDWHMIKTYKEVYMRIRHIM